MEKIIKSNWIKVLSFALAVLLVVGMLPIHRNMLASAAQGEELCIQVVRNGGLISSSESFECSFGNTNSEFSASGKTGEYGVWNTGYFIGEEYDGDNEFQLEIGNDRFSITKDLKEAESFLIYDAGSGYYSWSESKITDVKLISIKAVSAISGVANGTAKTAEALGLPETVTAETSAGEMELKIEWALGSTSYNPSSYKEQTFTVEGTVTLDDGIVCPTEISLKQTVQITVSGADDATVSITPTSANKKAGEKITLTAFATMANDTYTWYKDGKKITGKTSATLVLDDITAADEGEYKCSVEGLNGNTVFSNIVNVTVDKISVSLKLKVTAKSTVRPIKDVTLTVIGLPDDAKGTVKFSVEGKDGKLTEKGESATFVPGAANEYTFKAEFSGDDKYSSASDTEKLTLTKGTQEELSFKNKIPTEIWVGESSFLVRVEGGSGDGKIEYSIEDQKDENGNAATGIARVSTSGTVFVEKAGEFKVSVKKLGDDDYNDSDALLSATVKVVKREQSEITFADAAPENVVYNENGNVFVNKASGGSGSGEIEYSVNDNSIASPDNDNPSNLIIKKAGTVIVTACRKGDDKYLDASASYTLTIEKAEQTIEFAADAPTFVYYGQSLTCKAEEKEIADAADGKGYGSGSIVYSVVEGEETASIDAQTGAITFADGVVGTVKIKAEKAECDCYNKTQAEYTFEVKEFVLDGEPYTISGDKKNESGWYTGSITITADEGYALSTSNSLSDNDWTSSVLTISTEGDNNGITVYLRSAENGAVSTGIEISNDALKIDKTKPHDLEIVYSNEYWWEDIAKSVLFGTYDSNISFTVKAVDEQSGVENFEWSYDKDAEAPESIVEHLDGSGSAESDGENSYSATFTLPITDISQIRGRISFTATDEAGWQESFTDTRLIILDTTDPAISVSYTGNYKTSVDENNASVSSEAPSARPVYTGSLTATVLIEEANFWDDIVKVMLDGDGAECTWNKADGKYSTSLTINGDGEHTLYVECLDATYGNSEDAEEHKVTFTSVVIIDDTAPKVKVESIESDNGAKNGKYFSDDVMLKISVEEDNFNPEGASISIAATNAAGVPILITEDYDAVLKNSDNWENADNVHTISLKFTQSAVYNLEISYSDIASNRASDTAEFVIDKTAPDKNDIIITYDEDDIVNRLSKILYTRGVKITITAFDDISGIDYINWSYAKAPDASEVNSEAASGSVEHAKLKEESAGKYSAVVEIPKDYLENGQFNGNFSAEAFNMAGLGSESADDDKQIIVDTIAPGRSMDYGTPHIVDATDYSDKSTFAEGDSVKLFYSEKAELKLTISEANFYAEDINATSTVLNGMNCKVTAVKNSGEPYEITPTDWEKNGDNYTGTVTLSGDGEYVLTVNYNDRSGNVMQEYVTPLIVVDSVKPSVSGTVTPDGTYGTGSRSFTVSVNEKYFRSSDFTVTLNAYDLDGASASTTVADEWTHDGDVHTVTFTVEKEARYKVMVNGCDLSLNTADEFVSEEFVIDATAPEIKGIKYETAVNETIISALTFGYFNPTVNVTVTAYDAVSGIDKISSSYLRADGVSEINEESWSDSKTFDGTPDASTVSATFTLPQKSYNGFFSADATDKAQNTTENTGKTYTDSGYRVVVDSTAPEWLDAMIAADMYLDESTFETLESVEGLSGGWLALSKNDALIRFRINEANFYSEDFNGGAASFNNMECEITLTKDGGEPYPVKPEWSNDGDIHTGTVKISGDGDYRLNVKYTDRSGNKMTEYTSPIIAIDQTKPVISTVFSSSVAPQNGNCYKDDVVVTVKVEERYFRPESMRFSLTKAEDISGAEDENFKKELESQLSEQLRDKRNWTRVGSINTAEITFTVDANYAFTLNCSDIIGNVADEYNSESFTVDKTPPDGIIVEYSNPIQSVIIETLTFNYYNPSATVTVTARDSTSGVDYINWQYNRAASASSSNTESDSGTITDLEYSADGKTATGSFTLPHSSLNGQYNGNITVSAVDRSGNQSYEYKDDGTVIVIDTISPTREIEFSPAKQVVKAEDSSTVDNYDYLTEGSDYKLYYDAQATATIRITEANFYPEDVNIRVNGAVVSVNDWTQTEDIWTGTLAFESDGHYVVTIEYIDRSQNAMKSYVSNEIVVDTVDPVIKVTYSPDKVIKTIDDRKYYDAVQKATITITEHNFRASDVIVTVTAEDISGSKVSVEDYAEYLKKDSSWSSSGDTHTATITYSSDANYTFNIEYTDLALRKAAEYKQDDFSVDTTAPESLKISYSTSVLDTVINSVSFSFYNSKVRATISARDVTSGVGSFKYSYVKAAGASSVNTELIDEEIGESGITYSDGGKTATAYFDIPKQAIDASNQFRGTARFSATDRAGNVSETLADNKMLVVDNIAPVATVSFNQPVNTINGTAYYSGDIVADIEITEANFYPEDVHVTVNGNSVSLGSWTQKGDKWSNTLTVSADGEYKIALSYKDRSGNVMDDYQSEQLVIDRTSPIIVVSGIKNESANKGEKIGFRISASDTNLDIGEFKPQLTAVVMKDNGTFVTENIGIGAVQTTEAGKSYLCAVDNLEVDAIYTLTCKATDRSGNVSETMTVSDSGNAQLSSVSFSVNRNGSTFMLDEYTQNAVDKYYLGSVDNDIVIIETNVDPLSSHEVKLNQKTLVQGTDYTVTRSGGGASWYKYTYAVNSELFANEGEYSVVVSSVDKAETMAFSDIRNAEISFLVDQTAPEVVVSGLTKDGRYQTSKQLVTIIPTDDAGQVYSVKVVVKDRDGNIVSTPIELSGEALAEALEANENKLTFELGEGMYQSVEIICVDKSGNEFVSGEEYYNVTVSPSGWIILWANPVFKWSLFGGIAGAGLIIFLVVFLKKKKKEKQ